MATYTKQDIENLKDRIRAELPSILKANPGSSTGQIETLYCDANPALVDQFGMTKSKYGWSVVQVKVYDMVQELKKAGEIVLHKRGYYHPDFDLSTIPVKPKAKKAKKAKKATAPVSPVVEAEPVVEVSVSNPAVIEAHIDTETQELVENVGGSRDWRKPLEEVEDGYITSSVPSSVQVSTTTLEPVEVEDAPVEPVEVEEEVEATPVAETPVEDDLDLFGENAEEEAQEEEAQEEETQEEEDQQPSYDLKELRKSASFDPLKITLECGTGSYEVYRDMDARNIVLTQKGREDYVIVPVDVDQERVDALNEVDARYGRFALKSVEKFDTEHHHKDGCRPIVLALISCTHNCDHTDDFGGLVEPCMKPLDCPLQSIWGGVAIYVNPQDA